MTVRHYVPVSSSPDWAAGIVASKKLMLGEQRRSMGSASFRNGGAVGKVWVDGNGYDLLVCVSGEMWGKNYAKIIADDASESVKQLYANEVFQNCIEHVKRVSKDNYVIAPTLLNKLMQHPSIIENVSLQLCNYTYRQDSAGIGAMYVEDNGTIRILWFSPDVFIECLEKYKDDKKDEIFPYLSGLSTVYPDDMRSIVSGDAVAWLGGRQVMVPDPESELYTNPVALHCKAAMLPIVYKEGFRLLMASQTTSTTVADAPSGGSYATYTTTQENPAVGQQKALYPIRQVDYPPYEVPVGLCEWPLAMTQVPTLRIYYEYPSTGCTAYLYFNTSTFVSGQTLESSSSLVLMPVSTDGAFSYAYVPVNDAATALQSRKDSVTYGDLFSWTSACTDYGPITLYAYTSMSTNGVEPHAAYYGSQYSDINPEINNTTDYYIYLACIDPEFVMSAGLCTEEYSRTKSIVFCGLDVKTTDLTDILKECYVYNHASELWEGRTPEMWIQKIIEDKSSASVYVYLS